MTRGHVPVAGRGLFGVGAAAAPGHGAPGAAARTRQLRETPFNPRV